MMLVLSQIITHKIEVVLYKSRVWQHHKASAHHTDDKVLTLRQETAGDEV